MIIPTITFKYIPLFLPSMVDVEDVVVPPKEELMRWYELLEKNKDAIRIRKALQYVEGKKVLDFGCSFGHISYYLAKRGHEVVAIDISKKRINAAKVCFPHPNIKYMAGDIASLNLEENSFDCILFLEVIEHCKNPYDTLINLNKLLKKDGVLVISTPNSMFYGLGLDAIKQYSRKLRKKEAKRVDNFIVAGDINDHIYSWTPKTLYRLLNYTGFRYVDSDIVGARSIKVGPVKFFPFFHEMDFLEPVLKPYLMNMVFKVRKV